MINRDDTTRSIIRNVKGPGELPTSFLLPYFAHRGVNLVGEG